MQDWHVGVRNAKTNVLMGCITAVPVEVRIYDKVVKMAEINFLCVHKKLRYFIILFSLIDEHIGN
jgi:glycylpeptide N-tetradecanoyltransferase